MSFTRHRIFHTSEPSAVPVRAMLGLADNGQELTQEWISESVQTVSQIWALLIILKLCMVLALIDMSLLVSYEFAYQHAAFALALVCDVVIWLGPKSSTMRQILPHRQMLVIAILVSLSAATTAYVFINHPIDAGKGTMPIETAMVGAALLSLTILGARPILAFFYCLASALPLSMHWGLTAVPATAVLLVSMLISTLAMERASYIRRQNDYNSRLRGRRSELLLNEYEDAGRGWFWETDRTGCISYISETLAHSLKRQQADLIGRSLTDLVASDDRIARNGDRTLGFHLSARSSFSELAVRVAGTKDERWWSISGRPIVNEFGQFHGFRGSGSDLTEMRRSQAEVNRLAQYDSLTGLANRMQMLRTLEQAVVDGTGKPGECALFLLDLDRFKSVNDTMGHPAGDALLRQVSQRLQQVVGERGRVGRLGGDEFKVVLPGMVDRIRLGALADAVIATLSEPYMIEGSKVVIGASVGIALCPDDGVTTDALIRNADLALYAAKGDGRGVHRFYSSEMHADAEDRRRLEEDLRHALAEDGLSIVYQPVVSSTTEKISGFEALLRWEHPTRGSISPALFIPIAEDAGLISQIGEWVLRSACRDAARWPDPVRVAVNVSPIQFASPSLPTIVVNALAAAQLPPHRLELEITESVFLNDDESTEAMFSKLKAIGVRLALDDFGTGYSSLGYLKNAPFDKIKIDQSFVRGAAQKSSRNSAIIRSIVSLAEALGMDTTAEGVETHDELDLVRSLGCSHIQGYIYGRGVSIQDSLAHFADENAVAQANGFRASRTPRRTMLRSVILHHSGHQYNGRIRNISSQGALIEGLWNVPKDTIFAIELSDGLTVDAIARWSTEDRTGVQFAEEIDLRILQPSAPARQSA